MHDPICPISRLQLMKGDPCVLLIFRQKEYNKRRWFAREANALSEPGQNISFFMKGKYRYSLSIEGRHPVGRSFTMWEDTHNLKPMGSKFEDCCMFFRRDFWDIMVECGRRLNEEENYFDAVMAYYNEYAEIHHLIQDANLELIQKKAKQLILPEFHEHPEKDILEMACVGHAFNEAKMDFRFLDTTTYRDQAVNITKKIAHQILDCKIKEGSSLNE